MVFFTPRSHVQGGHAGQDFDDTSVLCTSVQRRRSTLLEGRLALQMHLHLCVKTLVQHMCSVYEAFGVWFFFYLFSIFLLFCRTLLVFCAFSVPKFQIWNGWTATKGEFTLGAEK